MYDILCYGALCADLRLQLPRFPRPGEGLRVGGATWTPGGNSLIEARALANWGAHVALFGDTLGYDKAGDLLVAELERIGLAAYLRRDQLAQTPVCHILLTPDGQRTILAIRNDVVPATLPPSELVAACRVVSITRFSARAGEVAALARAAGRGLLVGDATSPADPLAADADLLVTSAELLGMHHGQASVMKQMAALHALRGATVVVSDGPRPAMVIWREGDELRHASVLPPQLDVTDTTGAGDVLRAGLAFGWLQGWGWPHCLEFACAKASAACTLA